MSINPSLKASAGTGLAAMILKTVGARSQTAAPTQAGTFKSVLASNTPTLSESQQASVDSKLPGSVASKATASTTDVFSTGPGSRFTMSTPWKLSNGLALASGGGGNYAAGSSSVNEYGVNYQVQPNGVVVYTDQRSLA